MTVRRLAWILVVGIAWFRTIAHLAGEWRLNPVYHFGFAIPPIALLFAWRRFRTLPPCPEGGAPQGGRLAASLVAAGLGCFLLAELIVAVDPEWRMIFDLHAGAATLLTLAWLWLGGGAPLVRAMVFPLAFFWVAVPWPTMIEFPVMQGLMRAVTSITVDLLNVAGIAALQRGNVIELARGVVGVETACSGIQSFQASLMASLFLGELWRFSRSARVSLVVSSAAIAFAVNLARTFALTRVMADGGEAALAARHDFIGLTASIATFLSILAVAILMRRGSRREPFVPAGGMMLRAPTGNAVFVVLAAMALTPWLVAGWFQFRGDGARIQGAPLWTAKSEGSIRGFRLQETPIPAESLAILGCTESLLVVGRQPGNPPIQFQHFFWKPQVQIPSLASAHTPDLCLPNAGWSRLGSPQPVTLRVRGRDLPGVLSHFEQEGERLCVFHATWHGGQPQVYSSSFRAADRIRDRLSMLWEGRRNRGHEVLTLMIPAMGDVPSETRFCQESLEFILGEGR